MNTYRFRFNNSKKTSIILLWFFTTLLTITLSTIVLLVHSQPIFPAWLLLIFLPLMFISIYRLFKAVGKRQSTDNISLSKEGFISSCFGSVLFSEICSIQIPARQISLLGGVQYDYYKRSEANIPNLVFSITIGDGKTINWVLGEWGGIYNSKEDFSVFFDFLTALTNQLYHLYHTNEPYNTYLKIFDENGFWKKRA